MRTAKEESKRPQSNGFERLKFLSDFIRATGVKVDDLCSELGINRVTFFHWFKISDIKYSWIYTIVEYLGYTIDIFLTRDEDEATNVIEVDVDDFITLPGENYKPKRLAFLTVALRRYKIPRKKLVETCHLEYSSIRYWFQKQDMMWSRICQICDALDLNMKIVIKPKGEIKTIPRAEKQGQGDKPVRKLYSEIIMKSIQEF